MAVLLLQVNIIVYRTEVLKPMFTNTLAFSRPLLLLDREFSCQFYFPFLSSGDTANHHGESSKETDHWTSRLLVLRHVLLDHKLSRI